MLSDVDSFGAAVARRFRADTLQTFFANTVSRDPIAISQLSLPNPSGLWTERQAPEAAFTVHVVMSPLPRLQTRIGGRHAKLDPLGIGDICLFDLSTAPISLIEDPVESVRVHISQRTLDDLAFDRGQQRVSGLKTTFGTHDPVLYGLCYALQSRLRLHGNHDSLLLDHVALAFHAHLAEVYGQLGGEKSVRGRLAPWQYRRACDLMIARLSEGVGIAELAGACGLSAGYFARAFRQSAGVPAHRWLLKERIARAKGLLRHSAMALAEIAAACGFTDQSHLTRVFVQCEGWTPGRWRRLHHD